MDVKIRPYVKKFSYSYSFGVYPTIELLKNKPKEAIKVLFHSRGRQNDGVMKLVEMCRRNGVKTEVADGLIQKLTDSQNTYAVGVFRKYSSKITEGRNHLVLVCPEDTGNLGSIMRTALGFGVEDIAIIKPGVDCFDPKTVRASMGAVFQVNVEYFDDLESYSQKFKNKKYLFMTDGQRDLNDVRFEKPSSLIFGSESSGLEERYRNMGLAISIKQSEKIDSLNLSMAVGIALYKSYTS